MLWLIGGAVAVVAAIVVVVIVLTSGGGSSGSPVAAGGSSTPRPSTTSTGDNGTGNAPTTDTLPDNSASSSCSTDGYPDLVAVSVSVSTILGLTPHGSQPNSFVSDVLRDCTSAPVRTKITSLFGTKYGYSVGEDLTGGDGQGTTARYRLQATKGGSLTLTLTRQQDGHYEVTAFSVGR